VHRREGHRRRENAFAQLRALVLLAGNREGVDLSVDGKPVDAQVAVVANNAYTLEVFSIGERERLDEGRLHLYLARGWRPNTWDERPYERLTIDAGGSRMRAAIDGEPTELQTPLEFRIRARALRVLVPPAPG
jgi:diacylglycerol kinase family enzyme